MGKYNSGDFTRGKGEQHQRKITSAYHNDEVPSKIPAAGAHIGSEWENTTVAASRGEGEAVQPIEMKIGPSLAMVTDDEGGEEDGEEDDTVVQLQLFRHQPPRPSSLGIQPCLTKQILLKLLRTYESTGPYHTEVKHKLRRYTTTKLTPTKGDKFRRASSYTERNLKQVEYLLRKKGME